MNEKSDPQPDELDVKIESVAIQRIIDEIKCGENLTPVGYNRIYNRHNRS